MPIFILKLYTTTKKRNNDKKNNVTLTATLDLESVSLN